MSGRAAQLEYGYGTACHLPARGRYAGGHCDHQLGVALFKFAHLATTLSTRSTSALRSLPGCPLAYKPDYNAVFSTMQMIWGRRYVGFGTVANAVAVGLSSRFSMISSLRILHRPLPAATAAVGGCGCGVHLTWHFAAPDLRFGGCPV